MPKTNITLDVQLDPSHISQINLIFHYFLNTFKS